MYAEVREKKDAAILFLEYKKCYQRENGLIRDFQTF